MSRQHLLVQFTVAVIPQAIHEHFIRTPNSVTFAEVSRKSLGENYVVAVLPQTLEQRVRRMGTWKSRLLNAKVANKVRSCVNCVIGINARQPSTGTSLYAGKYTENLESPSTLRIDNQSRNQPVVQVNT